MKTNNDYVLDTVLILVPLLEAYFKTLEQPGEAFTCLRSGKGEQTILEVKIAQRSAELVFGLQSVELTCHAPEPTYQIFSRNVKRPVELATRVSTLLQMYFNK